MRKQDFLNQIATSLSSLPKDEVSDRLSFYAEMIDDRIEEGLSEEEAIRAVGSSDEVIAQILADIPLVKIAREKIKRRKRLKVWKTVLLWLGSPIWLSLLVAAFAVAISLYASLWAVVISLYATAFALGVSALGCILGSFFMVGGFAEVIVAWGAALVCAGLAILLVMLSNLAGKGMVKLTKLNWNLVFRRKERAV